MVDLAHPLVDRDAPCPAGITGPDGRQYSVRDDGTVSVPDDVVSALVQSWAAHYGVDPEACLVDPSGTCEVVKSDGDVCGRERPCPYHD